MLRAGPAVVIAPKPPDVTTTAGDLKFVRLKMLKKSAWNRSLNRSLMANSFRAEMSQVFKAGPWMIPTPALPRRPGSAAANAVVFTHGIQVPVQVSAGAPGSDTNTGPPRYLARRVPIEVLAVGV